MVNLLIYVGLNVQSEVCFWAVLGILRTILDASVAFKLKSNLKQIWQLRMPSELDVKLQRLLRAMVTGVMVVQCLTVYVYLAAYIVLLYPIFLEEKPALILPWLLLSLIRLLCELVNLSIGLATCVLLGSGKPPCVKFVLSKIMKIAMSVYMWKLVHWFYQILQRETYKPIAMVLPASKKDGERYNRGLELAVRRRRTKSLLSEEELRKSILSDLCQEKPQRGTSFYSEAWSSGARSCEFNDQLQVLQNLPLTSTYTTDDTKTNNDWSNIEVATPRDSDRVLDQFVTLILRIGIYLKMGLNNESMQQLQFNDNSESDILDLNSNQRSPLHSDYADSPPSVTSLSAGTFSYIREYPRIFLKDKSQRKLLQDNKNIIHDKHNNECSRISAVRIESDSSSNLLLKGLEDNDSFNLENSSKSIDIVDDGNSKSSSRNKMNANIEDDDKLVRSSLNSNTAEGK